MQGIVGVVSVHPEGRKLGQWVERMQNPLNSHPGHTEENWAFSHACFGTVVRDVHVAMVQTGDVILAMTGDIYEVDILREVLLREGEREASEYRVSEIILALFLRLGPQALYSIQGIYTILVWENEAKRLTIINDRSGYKRMYYWLAEGRLFLASELKAISGLPEFQSAIDELALFDFLAVNHLLEDRTLFEDIKLLPGASHFVYQDGVIKHDIYWDFTFADPNQAIGKEDDYLDGLAHEIREAVRRRVRARTCLLLTGGLDSRTIAEMYTQCADGVSLVTSTIGAEACQDVVYSRELAEALHLDHVRIPISPAYIADFAREGVWRTEGNMTSHAYWILAAEEFLREGGFKYVMTGVNGNGPSGRHWPPELIAAKDHRDGLDAILHRKKWKFELAAQLLKPQIVKNVAEETLNTIRWRYQQADTDHILNKFDYIWMHTINRRPVLCEDVLGEYTGVLAPFADQALVDYFFHLPPDLRVDGALYKKMIIKHLPRVARVSYQYDALSLNAAVLSERHKTYSYLNKAVRRIKNLPVRNGLISNDQPCINYNEWTKTGSRDFILSVLYQKEILADYFDLDAVDSLVQDHMAGRRNEFRMICSLVTFSLWRQSFVNL